MELPNKYFEDFPIEFKKVSKKNVNFKHEFEYNGKKNPTGFEFNKKIHKVTRSRYLNEDLQTLIKLQDKETMVINAPVGGGKSYAIIQTIKRFYDDSQDYLIIVATPFVSLVKQYVDDIHKDGGIPQNQIYNYEDLGRTKTPYLNKKIQVLTANTLLGNPGEDSYKNSDIKRNYLNNLINNCEKKGRKVVFIFDEIHDTIQKLQRRIYF